MNWEKELESALSELLRSPTPSNLAASMRYSVLSFGKRFRPRLMEAAAHLVSVPVPFFLPFAVALELIHAFTLIHDDLPCMDDDDWRRGVATNHKVYGEAVALLAGDALIPSAFHWTLKSLEAGCPHSAWTLALRALLDASGPRGVVGGQAQEFLLTRQSSLQELQQTHALKTGALFQAALLIPAHLAGLDSGHPSGQTFAKIQDFSNAFGLAFQIADDLEDETAKDETGKEDFSQTPATHILAHLSRTQAIALALEPLLKTTQALRQQWPETSGPLLAIADELIKKLRQEP